MSDTSDAKVIDSSVDASKPAIPEEGKEDVWDEAIAGVLDNHLSDSDKDDKPRRHGEERKEPSRRIMSRDRTERRRSRSRSASPNSRRYKRSRMDSYRTQYRPRAYDSDNRRGPPARRQALLTYKQWMRNQPDNIDPRDAQERYDRYRYDFEYSNYERERDRFKRATVNKFFEEHMGEEWFREKYDPLMLEVMAQERKQRAYVTAQEVISMPEAESLVLNVWIDQHKDRVSTFENGRLHLKQWPDNTVYLGIIPLNLTQKTIVDAVIAATGTESQPILFLSDPRRGETGFDRLGWVTTGSEEEVLKLTSNELSIGTHKVQPYMAINRDGKAHRVLVAPPVASSPTRMAHDVVQMKQLMKHLDDQMEIDENPLIEKDVSVDTCMRYLRKVHCFCYYCGVDGRSEYDLERLCGPIHLRKNEVEGEGNDEWENKVDNSFKKALDRPTEFVPRGYALSEREIISFLNENIHHNSEEGYHECGVCAKRFTEKQFAEKHIHLKHPELIEKIKEKAVESQFYRNYASDPSRPRGDYSWDSRSGVYATKPGEIPVVPTPPLLPGRSRPPQRATPRPPRIVEKTKITYEDPDKPDDVKERVEIDYGDI